MPSWTRNWQLASSRSSTPPARFGRATYAAGDLLITNWALRPSAYPSVTQSVIFESALHACVCVFYITLHFNETGIYSYGVDLCGEDSVNIE